MQSMMVKENVYLRNNVSFKKETEEIVLLQVKGLIIIVRSGLKKTCACFYHPPNTLLRDTKYCAPNIT